MEQKNDLINQYLQYTDATECPVIFSRWSIITGIGALLSRGTYLPLGHSRVYPNIYCMFIGTAGSRKSTSISIQKKMIEKVGYTSIAADKSSKEKFLLDLAGEDQDAGASPQEIEDFLWKKPTGMNGTPYAEVNEILIAADEFNNFLGNGNIEFLSLLGVLWDYDGVYKNRIKTGKSVSISNPTVSILAGNTPTGFHLAFPPEALGQGFFSRTLLIYGESRDRKYTFPESPDSEQTQAILESLARLRNNPLGELKISSRARQMLDGIYRSAAPVDDARFDSYNTRRFTHLLKLSIICSVSNPSDFGTVEDHHVLYANTILSHAELYMPKALGGFGKAKNSDVMHRVLSIIGEVRKPITMMELWKYVASDLDKITALGDIVHSLGMAGKIQSIPGVGFLPKKSGISMERNPFIDFNLLTQEERDMKI